MNLFQKKSFKINEKPSNKTDMLRLKQVLYVK